VEIPDTSLARNRGGKPFQEEGPITATARHWAKAVLTQGTTRSKRLAERRGWADVEDISLHIKSVTLLGARPSWDLETRRRILNLIRDTIWRQCKTSVLYVEIWEILIPESVQSNYSSVLEFLP